MDRFPRRWVGAAVGGALAGTAAWAGDPQPSEEPSLEEVVITGTNISGVAPVGSPLMTVGREDIESRGAVTTANILVNLPQVSNVGFAEGTNGVAQPNGSGNGSFTTSINLRGIGAFSTLTLLDGARVAPGGSTASVVDPTIMPSIMVQRIDILADGASATYGSDAVAGVVNLIPRRNFQGLEVSAIGGLGDVYNRQFNVLYGRTWTGGQITMGFQNQFRSRLKGSDVADIRGNDLRAKGGSDFRTANCTPGNVTFTDPVTRIPYSFAVGPNGQLLGTGTGAGQIRNLCDPFQLSDALPEQDLYSTAVTFDQALNDRISLNAFGIASYRQYVNLSAPGGGTISLPSSNQYFKEPPAGVTVPFCPGSTTVRCQTVSYNTLGYVEPNSGKTPSGGGGPGVRAYQLNVGADIKLFKDWSARPLVTYGGQSDTRYSSNGLAPGAQAPGAAALANGFNPFSSTQPDSALNPTNPLQNFTHGYIKVSGGSVLLTGNLTFDGTVIELPSGPVKAAVGYQHQNLSSRIGLVLGTVEAPIPNPFPLGYRNGIQRKVYSYFGEVVIPVFGAGNAIRGFQSLDLSAAVRDDRYDDDFEGVDGIQASTTNPKFGINWVPIEGLKLRTSYGTSFRVPTISQEYGNSAQFGFGNFTDWNPNPALGVAPGGQAQYPSILGPNPNIKPESATTKTFGFDFTPPFVPGLQVSVNYFDIDYELQQINGGTYSANVLVSAAQEALWAGTNIIVRNPSDAYLNSALRFNPDGSPAIGTTAIITRGPSLPCYGIAPGNNSNIAGFTSLTCNNWFSGAAALVDNRYQNLGLTLARGIDFQLQGRLAETSFGSFGAGVAGTYFIKFDEASSVNAPFASTIGTPIHPLRFKSRAQVNWSLYNWYAAVYVNHQGKGRNLVAPTEIASWTTFDARLSYNFPEGNSWYTRDLQLGLSATNILDRNPPFVNIAGGLDPTNSSMIRRLVQFSIEKKFW